MGHREDLLEGAKKCLVEKGFVRTTARDIVKASGANLASIGYHYGSKDALLTQAFTELMEEWGEVFKTGVDGEEARWSGSARSGTACSPSTRPGPGRSGRRAWRSR